MKKIVRWWKKSCSVAVELATHKTFVYDCSGRKIRAF